MERLSKYVARVSSFSRRKSEDLIKAGKVKVNKVVVLEPFRQVEPSDYILIDNQNMEYEPIKLYIALYKPDGFMSDLQDTRGRKMARDIIKIDVKLFPVGRLDYHSEGLMIFTNDGDFANEIMHPRYGVEKEYLVKFKGLLSRDEINKIKQGIMIGDSKRDYGKHESSFNEKKLSATTSNKKDKELTTKELYKVEEIRFAHAATKNAWYSVIINEGKNRMIRKIGEAINHPVLKLKRVRIGGLQLGDLQPGEYRYFEKKEILGSKSKQSKK